MSARLRLLLLGLAAAAAVAALAGCAAFDLGGTDGPPAAAPSVHVGDRWVYRGREGFRLGVNWEETHEVKAVGPDGITVEVTYGGPDVHGSRTEILSAPGLVKVGALMDIETRRFAAPLQRYVFPMKPGETWNQWVDDFNETTKKNGPVNRYAHVIGWDKVATLAGTFDALRVRVFMRLDDEEFWRWPTQCNYLVWYAPSVGATVREEKSAEYWEKSDRRDGVGAIRAQNTTLELVSYRHGA